MKAEAVIPFLNGMWKTILLCYCADRIELCAIPFAHSYAKGLS